MSTTKCSDLPQSFNTWLYVVDYVVKNQTDNIDKKFTMNMLATITTKTYLPKNYTLWNMCNKIKFVFLITIDKFTVCLAFGTPDFKFVWINCWNKADIWSHCYSPYGQNEGTTTLSVNTTHLDSMFSDPWNLKKYTIDFWEQGPLSKERWLMTILVILNYLTYF